MYVQSESDIVNTRSAVAIHDSHLPPLPDHDGTHLEALVMLLISRHECAVDDTGRRSPSRILQRTSCKRKLPKMFDNSQPIG